MDDDELKKMLNGNRKLLPESVDFVKYEIYFLEDLLDTFSESIETQKQTILKWLNQNTKIEDYIWQRDPFELRIKNASNKKPMHLKGKTMFGDNIEDEWFIVYLLFSISIQFPNLLIRIFDNDGQFLLIEAANHIPKWIQEENSEFRVWIRNGKIHIIPLFSNDSNSQQITQQQQQEFTSPSDFFILPPEIDSVSTALSVFYSQRLQTEASKSVNDSIQERIQSYPKKIYELQHHANCLIPSQIAYLLEKNPQLIASAVEAFHYRDLDGMKASEKMAKFSFDSNSNSNATNQDFENNSLILTRVTFTRMLYAQLQQQQFVPPKPFRKFQPPPSDLKLSKAFDLGVKLTCGFEMVYQQHKQRAQRNNNDVSDYRDVYFSIESILNDNETMKKRISELSNTGNLKDALENDDENWLNVSAQDLDDVLKQKFGIDAKEVKMNEIQRDMDEEGYLEELQNGKNGKNETNIKQAQANANSHNNNNNGKKKSDQDGQIDQLQSLLSNLKGFLNQKSVPSSVSAQKHQTMKSNMSKQQNDSENEEEEDLDDLEDDEEMDFFDDDEMESENDENNANEREEIKKTMREMSSELRQFPGMSNDFEKFGNGEEEDEEIDEKQEDLSMDYTFLKNFLEAYESQFGESGPASNFLNIMNASQQQHQQQQQQPKQQSQSKQKPPKQNKKK